jgi:hypothetical protein
MAGDREQAAERRNEMFELGERPSLFGLHFEAHRMPQLDLFMAEGASGTSADQDRERVVLV